MEVGFHGFSWLQRLVFHGFSRFQVDFLCFLWFLMGQGWFFMVFMVFHGFSWFQVGFSWFFMVPGQLEPPVSNEKVGVTKNEHFLELCQEQASNIFAIYLS